jgi:ribosomal protein L31
MPGFALSYLGMTTTPGTRVVQLGEEESAPAEGTHPSTQRQASHPNPAGNTFGIHTQLASLLFKFDGTSKTHTCYIGGLAATYRRVPHDCS